MRWPGSQEKLFQASRRADVHSPVEPSLRGIMYSWPSPEICEFAVELVYLWSSWLESDPILIFHVLGSAPAPAGPSKSSRQTRAKPGTSGAMMAERAGVFLEGFQMMRGDRGITLCPEDKNKCIYLSWSLSKE